MAPADIFFYVIFLGQILLISYFLPKRIHARMKHVFETYPPARYPKLYPRPVEHYRIGHAAFRIANRVILWLGVAILFALIFVVDHANFADDGFISEAWPVGYAFIQFIPLVALEILEFSQFRLMREANQATTRTADLRPRRLFELVSPKAFSVGVLLFLVALALDLFAHESDGLAFWLVGGNVFFVAMGAWLMFGRKLNPHQTSSDRTKYISAQLTSYLYISMAVSVFFITAIADDIYDLDFLDAAFASLYFQVLAFVSIGHLMRSIKLDDVDFDVYKEGAAAT